MATLQELFISNGWDTDYIAYAGTLMTALVLAGIYRYLNSDDTIE